MVEKVFVYGTLKKGFNNNYLLMEEEYLGEAVLKGEWFMTGWGFPTICRKELLDEIGLGDEFGFLPVEGELYTVSKETLEILDCLEGEGVFYQREKDPELDAWVYIINDIRKMSFQISTPTKEGTYKWTR